MTHDQAGALLCAECSGPIGPEPTVRCPDEGVRVAWVCAVHGCNLSKISSCRKRPVQFGCESPAVELMPADQPRASSSMVRRPLMIRS